MAPTSLRRSRRLSTRGDAAGPKRSGALQAIEENTVVALLEPARHFADPVKKPRAKGNAADKPADKPVDKGVAKNAGKKRQREEGAAVDEDRRRKKMLELLADLELQVKQRGEELVAKAEARATELFLELGVQLVYLPDAVRHMPWKKFANDYGGSFDNAIQALSSSQLSNPVVHNSGGIASRTRRQSRASMSRNSIQPMMSTAIKSTKTTRASRRSVAPAVASSSTFSIVPETPGYTSQRLSAFQTPMVSTNKSVPKTVLRTARKGEVTYSVRGSPILSETATKAPAGSVVATFADNSPKTCITLDNDRALDLSNPDQLTDETRADARSKLEALQAKVSELLKRLH